MADLSAEQLLELEKHKATEESNAKIRQAKWSILKWVLSTGFVSCAGVIANYQIESNKLKLQELETDRQLAIREKESEQEYLTSFSQDVLHENLQRRIDFAHYVSSVANSDAIRERWTKYHDELERNNTESRKDLAEARAKLEDELRRKNEEGVQNSQAIASLRDQISTLTDKIGAKDLLSNFDIGHNNYPVDFKIFFNDQNQLLIEISFAEYNFWQTGGVVSGPQAYKAGVDYQQNYGLKYRVAYDVPKNK